MHKIIMIVVSFVLCAAPVNGGVIKMIDLGEGRTEDNTLKDKVLVAKAPVEFLEFTQGFPGDAKLYRFKSAGIMGAKLRSKIQIDFGAIFRESLNNEAEMMGIGLGEGGWQIGGVVRALFYDMRTNGWAMFCYGTMVVDLNITSPEGKTFTERYMLVHYDDEYSKKGREFISELIIESCQDTIARLNVSYFRFPHSPIIEGMMKEISVYGVSKYDLECTAVGLSGSQDAAKSLLEIIETTDGEKDRAEIVDAIGRLQYKEAIPKMKAIYPSEDGDVRWYILKALSYMDCEESIDIIQDYGLRDDKKPCKALAGDILNTSNLNQP